MLVQEPLVSYFLDVFTCVQSDGFITPVFMVLLKTRGAGLVPQGQRLRRCGLRSGPSPRQAPWGT